MKEEIAVTSGIALAKELVELCTGVASSVESSISNAPTKKLLKKAEYRANEIQANAALKAIGHRADEEVAKIAIDSCVGVERYASSIGATPREREMARIISDYHFNNTLRKLGK